MKQTIITIVSCAAMVAPAAAQDLARTVSGIDRGTVRVSYATRPGTCGYRDNVQLATQRHNRGINWRSEPCIEGPALVQLEVWDGRVKAADVRVGEESWPSAASTITDLGRLAAPAAAASLLTLAERATDDGGEELVFVAILADSTDVVDPLQRLARSSAPNEDTRKAAVFWLGHGTDQDVAGILEDLAMNRDIPLAVRETAVFTLSQADEGSLSALQRIAQSDAPVELRENAVFWMGQTDDPQAVAYLVELVDRSDPLAEKAVFALSQHDSPAAQAALRRMVTNVSLPVSVRENAIFWLGQSDDPAEVAYLQEVYGQLTDGDLKEKIIFSVSQIGGEQAVTWLLVVAADRAQSVEVRKNALFWAGQSEGAVDRLVAFYDQVNDRDIKEQLIFVYSQADTETALRQLIAIARQEPDPDLRENAIFWLGQSDTPEATAFLEELIEG